MPERHHYLFVCYANVDRSPTAEAVCRKIVAENGLDIEASSAGMSDEATRPVTKKIADLADRIFVMEAYMATEMVDGYGQNPAKIVCLDVLDLYKRNDPSLAAMLEEKIYRYLAQEGLL